MTQAPASPRIVPGLGSPVSESDSSLPVLQLDKEVYDRALDCVHCGLCLPACPTYTQNGLEADSPRGRIYLMKGLADGKIDSTSAVLSHLDLCLDCRACETACPSGVVYHELIEQTRQRLGTLQKKGLIDRMVDTMFFKVFPYPNRLKLAILAPRLLQKLGLWSLINSDALRKALPAQLAKMQQMLPKDGPLWQANLAQRYPASAPDGRTRRRVGLFPGCIGSVMFQSVNRQTISLLQHAGCEVIVPREQGCCGAIHDHGGRLEEAQAFAQANIDVFFPPVASHGDTPENPPVETIVNNIAGCGAMLKNYGSLLRDHPAYADRAQAMAQRVRDVSELLVELDPPRPVHSITAKATYHDACHLAHAQKVTEAPRKMLSWIKGLRLVDLFESDMCCGAAGTYNLSQPAMARELAERKIRHIQETGAELCVTGNVGCAMQLQSEADRMGVDVKIKHPVSLLHQAYFGNDVGRE